MLHLGPLPAGLGATGLAARWARFIAGCGWGEVDTVRAGFAARDFRFARASRRGAIVLWFEHDLYDQLQLLQILDRLATRGPARRSLVGIDRHPITRTSTAWDNCGRRNWPPSTPAANLWAGRNWLTPGQRAAPRIRRP